MNTITTDVVIPQIFSKVLTLEKLLSMDILQIVRLNNLTLHLTYQECKNNYAHIFPKFENLQTLEIFSIRNQQLTVLTPILSKSFSQLKHFTSFSLSLNTCQTEDSNMEQLCKCISNLINLDSFNLKIKRNLSKQGLKNIFHCLNNLMNLTDLRLDFSVLNYIDNNHDTFEQFSKSLQRMHKLQKLFLNFDESYSFSDNDGINLSTGISNKLDLSILCLVFEKTSYRQIGIENLNNAISKLQNLKILVLKIFKNEDTNYQSQCMPYAPIVPLNIAKLPQLHTLIFEFSRRKITDNLAQQNLLQTFKNLSLIVNLQKLSINLEFTILTDDQVMCLAKSMGQLKQLKQLVLILNYVKLSEQQSQQLFLEISQLTQLKSLSLELDSTFIDVNPTTNLISCLNNLVNLSNLTLVLSNQLVDCKEFYYISKAIKAIKQLSFLSLKIAHMPAIMDIPNKDISCSISLFTHIFYLHLSFDFPIFGIHGAQQLSQGISKLINLFSLQLSFRFQKKEDINILEQLANGISKLQRLYHLTIVNSYHFQNKQRLLRRNSRLIVISDIEQTNREYLVE